MTFRLFNNKVCKQQVHLCKAGFVQIELTNDDFQFAVGSLGFWRLTLFVCLIGVNRRKQVIRRIRAILGKDGPSDKISKSASSVKRHAEVASLCSSNMSKFKFPYPKRGIGRVDLDEESVTSVWTFFQYNPISDRSQCNFCGYMLAGKNCTNLRVHLKSRHADLFEFDLTSGQVYGP